MTKNKNIKLSPQYGLNPSIEKCPVCGKEMGIVLYGKLKKDIEAPKYTETTLCDDCKKHYITLLEASDDKKLTGRCIYIKREAITENFRNNDTLLMKIEDFENLINNSPK